MEVQPHFPHELTEPEGEDVRPLFILLSVFVSVNETHSTKGVLCALKGYFGSAHVHLAGLCSEGACNDVWGKVRL